MGGVALFDLDRTLIDCNSGRLWVEHEFRGGRISAGDVVWAGYWLLRYSLGSEAGLERAFSTAVARLAGDREEELAARTEAWFAEHVRHRLRPGAVRALAHHRERGDQLVMATSSTSYAGQAACDAFGIEALVCTRFEVADGSFTGRVSELAVGPAKALRAQEWADRHGVDLAAATFYTDSVTDLALLERVGRPVAVNPDRALHRVARERGWEVVDWGRAAPVAARGAVVG